MQSLHCNRGTCLLRHALPASTSSTLPACLPAACRRVFPLEELAAAHVLSEGGHVRGKLGIVINGDLK